MVNLDRQIAVARARQGGFSAHVLPPGPVGYDPLPEWIFRPGALDMIQGPGGVALPAEIVEKDPAPVPLEVSYQATGGAGGGPRALFSFPGGVGGQTIIRTISPDERMRPIAARFTLEAFISMHPGDEDSISTNVRVDGLGASRIAITSIASNFNDGTDRHLVSVTVHNAFTLEWAKQSLPSGFHHYALSADGNTVRMFYDGRPITDQGFTPLTSGLDGSEAPITSEQIPASLGWFRPADARFPTGVARSASFSFSRFIHKTLYTSNFTPPQL